MGASPGRVQGAQVLRVGSTIFPAGQAVRTKYIVLKWAEERPIEHLTYSIRNQLLNMMMIFLFMSRTEQHRTFG